MAGEPEDFARELRGLTGPSPKLKKRLGVALLVLGAGAVFGYGPYFALGRGEKSYLACSNRDYEERPHPEDDCAGGRIWLGVAKLVPWTRGAALKSADKLEHDVARRAHEMASGAKPDRARRGKAADALAGVIQRASPGSGDDISGLAQLAVDGDEDALARYARLANSDSSQRIALSALISTGQIGQAVVFARSPPPRVAETYDAIDLHVKRGALLCLGGDRDAGLAAFREAERVHRSHQDFPCYAARIARAACGDDVSASSDELDHDALLSYRIEKESPASLQSALMGEHFSSRYLHEETASPFVAAILTKSDHTPDEMLRLCAAPRRVPFLGMSMNVFVESLPDETYSLVTRPLLLDPERHEKAAELLERAATAVRKESAKTKQAADVDTSGMPVNAAERYKKIRFAVADNLAHFADGFWIEAAAARAHQRDCDGADRDLTRALALENDPDTRLLIGPLFVLCGRYDRMRVLLESVTFANEAPGTVKAWVKLERALSLAHDGRFPEALSEARQARSLVGNTPKGELSEFSSGVQLEAAANFLILAFSRRAGDKNDLPALFSPEIYERSQKSWFELATMPEDGRVELRFRMRGYDPTMGSLALPAEIDAVAGVATGAGDVEVWLDKELGVFDPRYHRAAGLRARAEAARWRGDSASETSLLARAAALEKFFTDPKKRILAHIAGM